MTIRVLLDACLLVKGNVSNILLDLSDANLIELHWTTEIADETFRNWMHIQLAKDASDRAKLGKPRAHTSQEIDQKAVASSNRLDNFELLVPEWRIPGWDYNKCARELLPELLTAEVTRSQTDPKLKVDPKDVHVALASMKLKRVFPEDDVWLATENIDDLPPEILSRVGVSVMIPGVLIEILYSQNPVKVVAALQKTIDDSNNPKLDHVSIVGIIESENQFGSDEMAKELRNIWGV